MRLGLGNRDQRGSSKRDQMGGQSMKGTDSRMGWSAVSDHPNMATKDCHIVNGITWDTRK